MKEIIGNTLIRLGPTSPTNKVKTNVANHSILRRSADSNLLNPWLLLTYLDIKFISKSILRFNTASHLLTFKDKFLREMHFGRNGLVSDKILLIFCYNNVLESKYQQEYMYISLG